MFYTQAQYKNSTFSGVLLGTFLALCCLTSNHLMADDSTSLTKVYKDIDNDGSVSFSDQPSSQSETILVSPVPTVPAIDPKTATAAPKIQSKDTERDSYTSLSILAPANESAFYSASGEVDVILDVKPALLKEDKIEFYLDNKLVKTDRQLQVRLPSVNRGTHKLKARLISPDGSTLKESVSIFTIHQPSVRN